MVIPMMDCTEVEKKRMNITLVLALMLFLSMIIDYSTTLYFSGDGELGDQELSPFLRMGESIGHPTLVVIVMAAIITFLTFGVMMSLHKVNYLYKGVAACVLFLSITHFLGGTSWYLQSAVFSQVLVLSSVILIAASLFLVAFSVDSFLKPQAFTMAIAGTLIIGLVTSSMVLPYVEGKGDQPYAAEAAEPLRSWSLRWVTYQTEAESFEGWTDDGGSTMVDLNLERLNATSLEIMLTWTDDTSSGQLEGEQDTLWISVVTPEGEQHTMSSAEGELVMSIALNQVPKGFVVYDTDQRLEVQYYLDALTASKGLGAWSFTIGVESRGTIDEIEKTDDGNSWKLELEHGWYEGLAERN